MPRFIFLTNIPTPYRVSFYNELIKNNLNFSVYFMRIIESDRKWKINLEDFKFPFYIDNGIYFMLRRLHIHINLKLIFKIFKNKNSEIIICGSWNDIDVLILVFLKKLGIIKNKFHFWSEANHLTIGASNDNFLKYIIRKFVFNTCDGFQLISGRMTEITFDKWTINYNNKIFLPNTIEEEIFQINDHEVNLRSNANQPVFLIPVRLIENIKGVVNYFQKLGRSNIIKAKFYIAGDGPDRKFIENYISSNQLNNYIFLLGNISGIELSNLYRNSNALILPSFSDPSPLTVVESICMKLPIIISNRCGNHFEALIENRNGYIFDPYNQDSIRNSFNNFLSNRIMWRQMGDESYNIYMNIFNREKVVKNFVLQLKSS